MITPDMSFQKSIQLSISDLEEAKNLAEKVNDEICTVIDNSFPDGEVNLKNSLTEDGTYLYEMENASVNGQAKLVVGWDMKNVNGENQRFMAINFSGKCRNNHFVEAKETLEKLPNYGYFGGMLGGALLAFAICMIYAYYSEALDVFFFAIFILVFGWLSSKLGEKIGENSFDSGFDKATAEAMADKIYLKAAAQTLSFNEEVIKILDKTLEEDKLRAVS